MSYNHYRHNPGWGTHQFQLGAPPLLGYQPQPSWTGQDFYSAHAMGADPYFYQNTISRMSSGMGGVGKYEARHLHRRAYAGLGEVAHMMPQEIGIAAAYEAYRHIKYGTNVYQNLYTDYERQREAMRALAIAEAQRLWYDTGRAMDQYGIQMACDAAAATASRIATERELEEGQGYGMGLGAGSFRDRRSSFGALSASGYAGSGYAGSGYAGSGYAGSGYAGSAYGGGGSVYGGASPLQLAGTLPGSPIMSSPMTIPGSPLSVMGGGVPYAGSVGMSASYGGGYPGSYGTPGHDYLGLPNAGYPMGGYSAPGTPAGGAIVIHQPEGHHHRSRSRRHHHHHHRRHRSQGY